MPDNQPSLLNESYTKENDRPGEKTQGLDVEENEIPGLMETGCTENMGVGFCKPAPDEFHDLPGTSLGNAFYYLAGI